MEIRNKMLRRQEKVQVQNRIILNKGSPSNRYVLPVSGLGEPTFGTIFAPGMRNPELSDDLLDHTL